MDGRTSPPTPVARRGVLAVVAGLAAGAALLVPIGCGGGASPDREPTFDGAPILLISVDTLRSDHLPAYGYEHVDTPHIDALRRDAVLFARAYSHSPITLPSHTSMLTGLLPADHGVRNNIGFTFDASRHATVPQLLRERGYVSGAAVSAYVLRRETGLAAPFDAWDDAFLVQGPAADANLERRGAATVAAARGFIAAHAERPFFYFLHLFEPHTPYEPPEPYRSRYELAYDGEIASADAALGELFSYLREVGIYDRAVIVLLSDHGEGLGDHGEAEHGIFLYREVIQVPLIIKLPGNLRAGSTVEEPVQLIDLLPTLVPMVGGAVPDGLAGRNLFSPRDEEDPEAIVAETLVPRIHFGWSELWSVIVGRHQLIVAPRPELYDLVDDPAQRHNLVESRRADTARLARLLEPHLKGHGEPVTIDPDEARRLRALGYVSAPARAGEGPLPDPKDRIGAVRQLDDAAALASQGRAAEAVALLRELVDENPGLTAGWLQLARALTRAGRLEEAISAHEQVLELAPTLIGETSAALAEANVVLGRLDQAETWAERCVASGSAAGHVLLARIRIAEGKLEDAEAHARRALDDSVYGVVAAVVAAEAAAGQGRLDEGLALVEGAHAELHSLGLDPVPRLQLVRGDILGRLERYDQAEDAFRAEIGAFPDSLRAYTSLAVIYYVTGRSSLARGTLEGMVEANPHPVSLMLAARTAGQVGDREAAAEFERRLAAAPRPKP